MMAEDRDPVTALLLVRRAVGTRERDVAALLTAIRFTADRGTVRADDRTRLVVLL